MRARSPSGGVRAPAFGAPRPSSPTPRPDRGGARSVAGGIALLTAVGSLTALLPHASATVVDTVAVTARAAGGGYTVTRAGTVTGFGGASVLARTGGATPTDVVAIVATSDGRGYWLASATGAVTAYGDARLYAARHRRVTSAVGMIPTVDDRGYWLASASGAVTAFGDARLYPRRDDAVSPVVGIARTVDGRGYRLVSARGAVATFGDARLDPAHGRRVRPVVGLATTADDRGYWLASADGAVAPHGDARALLKPRTEAIVGIAAHGTGYYLVARDGTVLAVSRLGREHYVLRPPGPPPTSTTLPAPTTTTTSPPATTTTTTSPPATTTTTTSPPATTTTTSPPATTTTTSPPATTTTTSPPATTTTVPPGPSGGPLLGALDSPVSDGSLSSAGYRSVVVAATWASIEPAEGVFSPSATAQLQDQIDAASGAGLSPSLDIGVQYAPQWIYSVGGGTQLEDQYGDIFGGSPASGNDVPNAVTDGAVRTQLGVYLVYLGSHLTGLASVRLGGGPDNELRYPSGYAGSQPGAFWFYDTSSQSLLPADVQGWTPGTGTSSQAATFLTAYDEAMTGYGQWLVTRGGTDFPGGTKVELLLPGWGERPGELSTAADDLLTGTPDEVNQGLDWPDLIPSLPGGGQVVAYSTYADATQGSGDNPDPAAYIHQLLPAGVLEGGESTGNGQTVAAGEDLMFSDARQWGWYVANWFFGGQTQSYQQVAQAFSAS